MQIQTIKYNNLNNLYSNNAIVPQKKQIFGKIKNENNKNNQDNKVLIGVGIATLLLLAIVFRKKIANLFKEKKTTEPPKPETVKPESPKTEPQKPEPPKIEEVKVETPEFNAQETLSEYRKIVSEQKPFPNKGTEEEKAAWREVDEKRRKLLNQLCDNNVSLVEKKNFPLEQNVMLVEKMEYLRNIKSNAKFNKASQIDVINEYDKYASRYWFNEDTGDSYIFYLTSVCLPIDKTKDDKEHWYWTAEKFISIAERIAERDNTGMRDAIRLLSMLEDYGKIMDEKLALRYIELLKKISFQQQDEFVVAFKIKHLQDNPAIKQAMQEYHDILQQFPHEDKSVFD